MFKVDGSADDHSFGRSRAARQLVDVPFERAGELAEGRARER
jgi:hypothetical protein